MLWHFSSREPGLYFSQWVPSLSPGSGPETEQVIMILLDCLPSPTIHLWYSSVLLKILYHEKYFNWLHISFPLETLSSVHFFHDLCNSGFLTANLTFILFSTELYSCYLLVLNMVIWYLFFWDPIITFFLYAMKETNSLLAFYIVTPVAEKIATIEPLSKLVVPLTNNKASSGCSCKTVSWWVFWPCVHSTMAIF